MLRSHGLNDFLHLVCPAAVHVVFRQRLVAVDDFPQPLLHRLVSLAEALKVHRCSRSPRCSRRSRSITGSSRGSTGLQGLRALARPHRGPQDGISFWGSARFWGSERGNFLGLRAGFYGLCLPDRQRATRRNHILACSHPLLATYVNVATSAKS